MNGKYNHFPILHKNNLAHLAAKQTFSYLCSRFCCGDVATYAALKGNSGANPGLSRSCVPSFGKPPTFFGH